MNKRGNMLSDRQRSFCKNYILINETNVPDVMLALQSSTSVSWEKWKRWHGRRTHSRGYWRSGRCSCFTLKSESDACQIDLITQMAHNRWDVMPENSFMLKTWHQNAKLIHHPRSDCIHLSLWSLIAMETPRVQKSVPNVFFIIIINLLLAVVEGITKVFVFFQSSLLLWSTDCSFTFSLSEKIHHQSFFFFDWRI